MGFPYDKFVGAFLGKVTDYGFPNMDSFDRQEVVDGYMKRACAKFNKICKYDLMTGDDVVREFDIDVKDEDVDEIVDIISEGMLVEWMKPYVYRSENLQNFLNTKDFSIYSPAELLYRIKDTYNMVKRDFWNMMKEYSYNHGDLGGLSL